MPRRAPARRRAAISANKKGKPWLPLQFLEREIRLALSA